MSQMETGAVDQSRPSPGEACLTRGRSEFTRSSIPLTISAAPFDVGELFVNRGKLDMRFSIQEDPSGEPGTAHGRRNAGRARVPVPQRVACYRRR